MFIPYLGEKSKFSNFIIPNIPTNISHYVEPFGGMFGIFFSLDHSLYQNTKFIYNDINKLNSNLISQLSNSEFRKSLFDIEATETLYYSIQNDILVKKYSDIDLAINWLILLSCSFSQYQILDGKWKGNYEFEVIKSKIKFENFNKIITHNLDYKSIIERYDSETTFFYLDPPYRKKEHYYINHNFTDESHYELSQILKDIRGRFALSYYHFPEIDDWYKGCNIIKNKTLMGTEFLIMNY